MYRFRQRSRQQGQGIIEAVTGAFFFVPICLLGVNLSAVILANSINDSLAKNAARAAANQETPAAAQTAAQQVLDAFPKSVLIPQVVLSGPINYQSQNQVAVQTIMEVKIPAPIAGLNQVAFHAQAIETIVGAQANI